MRLKDKIVGDRLTVIAAGVAFYGLLASFPTLAALVSIVGLVVDPQQVSDHLRSLGSLLPPEAAEVLVGQLRDLVSTGSRALGLGFAGSLLLALWGSSAGMRVLMKALNAAYDVHESRSFVLRAGVSLLLALGAIFVVLFAMLAIVVVPGLIGWLGLDVVLQTTLQWLRWPIMAVTFWLGLVLLYRYGPDQRPPWSWADWGALVAVMLWLGGSSLFSWYVGNFGNFNKTYGSMGAVVVLLLWFLLSAWAVLLGAEINAIRQGRTGTGPAPGSGRS
jgi:membrane protein